MVAGSRIRHIVEMTACEVLRKGRDRLASFRHEDRRQSVATPLTHPHPNLPLDLAALDAHLLRIRRPARPVRRFQDDWLLNGHKSP